MANFSAMFAGCESYMEGDVEINNDVTVPAGDAAADVETETTAEELGAEGAETVAESDNEVADGEAANMVFDQVLSMYDHVAEFGVDRTFLSLYNRNGQLDNMIGFNFPSMESIDSVGSPRSAASQAFLVAMESDGIFAKIWEWIKKVCKAIMNFFIKIADWFREVMGNQEIRVGKLLRRIEQSEAKSEDKLKGVKIATTESSVAKNLQKHHRIINDIVIGKIDRASLDNVQLGGAAAGVGLMTGNGGGVSAIGAFGANLAEAENLCVEILDQACKKTSNAADGLKGKYKDYTKKLDSKKGVDEVDQAKHFAKMVKAKAIDKIKKDISKIGAEKKDWDQVDLPSAIGANKGTKYNTGNIIDILTAALNAIAEQIRANLSLKQFIERMKLNQKHMNQQAEVGYRLANGNSMDRDASEDGRKATQCFNIIVNVRSSALSLDNSLVGKCINIIASHMNALTTSAGAGNGEYKARTVLRQ